MYGDKTPIEVYVGTSFMNPRVMNLTASWRVESEKLQEIASTYFKEMGIYFVEPNQRQILLETMITCLRHSTEVKMLIKKAESEENERKRTRHADV